jgi:glutamate N-acetyltransferase/amino-acid N-acetyltransferase
MSITFPLGFRAAGTTAGLKRSGRPDLALIVRDTHTNSDTPRTGAALSLTTNLVVGAPIVLARRLRERLAAGGPGATLRAILVNAGNANAATGDQGLLDAEACAASVARALDERPEHVLPSSTGVIGRPLPVAKIVDAVPALVKALSRGPDADSAAATAIMTTDLVPKQAHREVRIGGHAVRLGAIAKGSGMIAPRLDSATTPTSHSATMLAFITTDAAIDSRTLQLALDACSDATFNRISVDNHASCSDSVVAFASGAAGTGPGANATPMLPIRAGTPDFDAFSHALHELCTDLATQIVRDGEGATRLFRVEVVGTHDEPSARRIAREIVNSPLVKCAIHGRDPNWGRIVTAAGNAGVRYNAEHASLAIGPVVVYQDGVPKSDALNDPRLRDAMSAGEVPMTLRVGSGPGASWMVGCDLSNDYVRINAEYTT